MASPPTDGNVSDGQALHEYWFQAWSSVMAINANLSGQPSSMVQYGLVQATPPGPSDQGTTVDGWYGKWKELAHANSVLSSQLLHLSSSDSPSPFPLGPVHPTLGLVQGGGDRVSRLDKDPLDSPPDSFRVTHSSGEVVTDVVTGGDVKFPSKVGFGAALPPPSPPKSLSWADRVRVVSPSVHKPEASKGVGGNLVPSSFGVERMIFVGDPPSGQLPPWKTFRAEFADQLEGLVPKRLWWRSTPGWWYTPSGPNRMRDFIFKRLDMVEKLGKGPVVLLLSLLSSAGFSIPENLSCWADRSPSVAPGERRSCSFRLRSSGRRCLDRNQKLWTAIDHALACRASQSSPYAITIADLAWPPPLVSPTPASVTGGSTDSGGRAVSVIGGPGRVQDSPVSRETASVSTPREREGSPGMECLDLTPVTRISEYRWGDEVDVSPTGKRVGRASTDSNTVLFCHSPEPAGADTDVDQSPSPRGPHPRTNHPDAVSPRPPISAWLHQDSLPDAMQKDKWNGWFRIRGDGNCAIRAVVAGLSLLGNGGWARTICGDLENSDEGAGMAGDFRSHFDDLDEAVSLVRPDERLARLSTLMSQSDWTSAIRFVLASKAADLPTAYEGAADEISRDGANLAFHDVGTLGSLLGCRVTIYSSHLPDKCFEVSDSHTDSPHVALYHHGEHFDLLCPVSAAPQSVLLCGTDGGRLL